MARSTVEVEILAEIQQANKTIKQFADQTEKQLKGINTSSFISAFVDGFGFVKDAAESAFSVVKDVASAAISEAADAEDAQNKLANALKLSGQFSEEQVKIFDDLANSLQDTTAFSDETVLAAAALAKQYNLTNKEAAEVVRVSADLAAVTGESLDSAVRSVAQSFNGFVDKGLAKTIPGLKNLSQESLIAGGAIDIIRGRVEGSAEALGNTFSGSIIKAQNSFSDLLETMGGFVTNNPIIIESIKIVQDVIKNLNNEIKNNSGTISEVFVSGFKAFVSIFPAVVNALRFIDSTVSTTTLAFVTLGRSIGAITAAFAELAKGNISAFKDINRAVTEDNKKTFEDNRKRLEAFYDPLVKAAKDASDRINNIQKDSNAKQISLNQDKNDQQIKDDRKANAIKVEDVEKAAKEAQDRIANIAKNPIAFQLEEKLSVELKSFRDSIGKQRQEAIATAAGFLASVAQGAEGARKIVTSTISAAFAAAFGPIGGAVGQIVDLFSQGPEKTREMVRSFAQAIPTIIQNIIESIPVFIEELAKALPVAFAKAMPIIATQFAINFVRNIPTIIRAFIEGIVEGAQEFVNAIVDLIPGGGAISGRGSGGIFEGIPVLGGIGDVFGFAEGGRVPDSPQFSGDRFPARLSAGEQVISKDLSNDLENFLRGQSSGQPLVINLRIGEQQLAQSILNLNRRGFRTA